MVVAGLEDVKLSVVFVVMWILDVGCWHLNQHGFAVVMCVWETL